MEEHIQGIRNSWPSVAKVNGTVTNLILKTSLYLVAE